MLAKFPRFLLSQLKQVFKTEDSRFILSVGLKVSGISFCITLFIYWFLMEVMRLNYAFFRAHGFASFADGTPFFDLIFMEASESLPFLFGFHIMLFFVGSYVGWLILRPFKAMAEYCEQVIEKPNVVYKVDEFSTYNLFTRFSEFFFEYLRESRHKNEIFSNSIPPQYSRIHKPVMDKVFMLHFGLLFIIIAIISGFFIVDYSTNIYESMVELATRTLKDQKSVTKFFSEQMFILEDIVVLTMVLIAVSYTMLGFHLYAKVSGAAFAIFSTMRSYMKGNYSSRVHLVGYSYLRDYTRKLNKYLDYVQNYFAKDPTKNKTL